MTNCSPARSYFRRLSAAVLLTLGISHSSLVIAAVTAGAPSVSVLEIQQNRVADIVLLNGGFSSGLRQGMVCRVTRGTTEVAEVLLVEIRPTCSAALILNLSSRQSIRAGDLASVKVLKT